MVKGEKMKIAQILNNKFHWIFEADGIPVWPPDPDGNPIVLVDITGRDDISEGDDYDPALLEGEEDGKPGESPEPHDADSPREDS